MPVILFYIKVLKPCINDVFNINSLSPSHENWWNKETHSFSNRRWTCASPQYQLIYPKNKSIPNIIFFSKGLKIVIASKTLIINISKYIRSSDICMYIHTKHIHRYSFHEIKKYKYMHMFYSFALCNFFVQNTRYLLTYM